MSAYHKVTVSYSDTGGRLAFVYDPVSSTVTYDHTALTSVLDSGVTAATTLKQSEVITAGGTYDQLPDIAGYRHTGWNVDGRVLEPEAGIVRLISHTICSVWEPIVTYDHTALTGVLNDGGTAVSTLKQSKVITAGGTYDRLPDTAGYRHTGWRIGGVIVEPTAGLVLSTHHVAASIWDPLPVVTFDARGGSCDKDRAWVGADGRLSALPIPTMDFHRFEGWFDSESDGNPVTEGTVFGDDAVIYAYWSVYRVTYDHTMLEEVTGNPYLDEGLDDGMEISEGAAYGMLPDTAGYRHTGWSIGGETVGPTAGLVMFTPHVAQSVWERISDDGDDVDPDDGEDVLVPPGEKIEVNTPTGKAEIEVGDDGSGETSTINIRTCEATDDGRIPGADRTIIIETDGYRAGPDGCKIPASYTIVHTIYADVPAWKRPVLKLYDQDGGLVGTLKVITCSSSTVTFMTEAEGHQYLKVGITFVTTFVTIIDTGTDTFDEGGKATSVNDSDGGKGSDDPAVTAVVAAACVVVLLAIIALIATGRIKG